MIFTAYNAVSLTIFHLGIKYFFGITTAQFEQTEMYYLVIIECCKFLYF